MLSEIFNNFYNRYALLRGDGKILVLFLVALLFLYVIRKNLNYNPFILLLSPLGAISVALSEIFRFAKGKILVILVSVLSVLTIILSGQCIYSQNHAAVADSFYYIPNDYVEVMDFVLSLEDNPKVLAMPDYSIYHGMYSSRFDMMYEKRQDEDIRYLSEDARNAFNELLVHNPDMKIVSDAAIAQSCDYIILKKNYYWSEFPLTEYEYDLLKSFDGWEVYGRKGGGL